MTLQRKIENIKNRLKKYRALWSLNARVKCIQTKRQYERLCRYYGTPSVRSEPEAIIELGRCLWKQHLRSTPKDSNKPRVLWIGTDYEQDRSGILQALSKVAEVTVFHNDSKNYGQLWPTSALEIERCRRLNGQRLISYLMERNARPPFDLIIGQMWGLSMDIRALSVAREMGVHIINISMDDRHAFTGRKLADGTPGGTLGLVPYLSLACTDAPECVRWYEKEGCRAIFFPEASDPEIFSPREEPKIFDVSFVGARYGIREKIVKHLERAGVKVQAYGTGWPSGRIPTEQVPTLFSRSRVVLGCGTIRTCEDFFALKLRDFDVPMSGACYVTHENPDLNILYEVGKDILTFNSIPELIDMVRSILKGEVSFDGRRVRANMIKFHTWERRFNHLVSRFLEGIK